MRKLFFTLAIVSCSHLVSAQDQHTSYTEVIKNTEIKFEMAAIPGGEFQMGSKNGKEDERPVHQVQVDPFWMSTHEVTWDVYEAFLYKDFERRHTQEGKLSAEIDAVTRPTKPYLDMTFGMGKEGRPALGMTNYNAIQFCKWLYTHTGEFYRLPTEAEWEYACRAGSETDYYFGDDASQLGDYAWFKDNSDEKVHKVGEKRPNAWGLYDMLGNVCEWVYDQYIPDYYATLGKGISKNPLAEPTTLYPHVVRGGSFESTAEEARSASRLPSDPAWKNIDPQIPKSNWWFPEAPFVGMRLVRPVVRPSDEEIKAYYDKAPIDDF